MTESINVLGLSAYYHDSAACLVHNGNIIAAVQEERFTRIKHDNSFPISAINYCLTTATISAKEIDYVVFYEKPFLKFERLLETYLAFAPSGFRSFCESIPVWIRDKLFQKRGIINSLNKSVSQEDWSSKLLFFEHHLSHAASAFYPSPFERAAVLTLDAVGEWTTTSLAIGNGNQLKIEKEIDEKSLLKELFSDEKAETTTIDDLKEKSKKELEELLKIAVQNENYESAAKIRDEISNR